jgi:hypothetical protein
MAIDLPAILLPAAVSVIMLAIVLFQGAKMRRALDSEQAMRGEIEALGRDIKSLQQDFGAFCSGASGVGTHLSRVDRQLMRLLERQDQFEVRDSIHSEYDQAVRMIRRGASIDEIISQCNLARAEAELLSRLHAPEPPGSDDDSMRSVA